jgi:glycosyltransferase involved in cell wall biosynthesis
MGTPARDGHQRILYLNPVGTLGGAERVLLNVLAAVRQVNPAAELHLLALAPGPLLDQARQAGAHVTCLPMPPELHALGDSRLHSGGASRKLLSLAGQAFAAAPAAWEYVRRLRRQIDALAPALVHSNGIKTHLLLRLAGVSRIPVLWHVHDFYSARPLVRRLVPWAGKGLRGLLAVSDAVSRDVGALLPKAPRWVVHNTADVARFAPAEPNGPWLDALAGLPPAAPGAVRVGLVATYARWKGHEVFLRAAARALAERPQASLRFYVIGSPIYQTEGSQYSEAELRALARTLRVDAAVGFVPFQSDPVPAYRALDVVVHASTRPEPFGLTILEAMACQKAVIAVPAGGAAELFRSGYDALGIPPGDAGALADAVGSLAGDPARRRTLGENARRTVVGRFGQGRLGGKIWDVYRAVWGAAGHRGAQANGAALAGSGR